jgi:hypothetical protein
MASLVTFDQKGVFGPAMALVFNSQYYNEQGLSRITTLLKENFFNLAHRKPHGRKAFCAFVIGKTFVTPIDVISTSFFQNMQKSEPSPHYEKVLALIVPNMLKTAQEQIQVKIDPEHVQKLSEWTARVVQSYMTEQQIEQHIQLQSTISEKIMEKRKKIGGQLYALATCGKLTETDLNFLLEISKVALERLSNTDHVSSTLNVTGKYLSFFALNEQDPRVLGNDVLSMLSSVFREKMFPKNT